MEQERWEGGRVVVLFKRGVLFLLLGLGKSGFGLGLGK